MSHQPGQKPFPSSDRTSTSPVSWILLYAVWVLLSGKFDFFHLALGAFVVGLVAWQHAALTPIRPPTAPPILLHRLVPYFLWLIKDMVFSALYVARVVIKPEKHLDPHIIRFRAIQPSPLNAIVLGHSIALTPGTTPLDLDRDVYTVHALTPATSEDLLTSSMPQRVARLSSGESFPPPQRLPAPEAPEPS